jgi:hypothetical protein
MSDDTRGDRSGPDPTTPEPGAKKPEGVQRGLPEHLGRHLRAAYSELVNEPVPDKFLELLKRLESGGEQGGARS